MRLVAVLSVGQDFNTSEPSSATDRLDSWKDIAAYLHRDVSTVQRWEKREGMPVHRHVHEKLGTVYAFRSEIDAWSRGRGGLLAQQDVGEVAAVPENGERGTRTLLRAHRRIVLAGSIALALVGAVAFVIPIVRTPARDGDAASLEAVRGGNAEAQDLLRQARYLSVRTTDADNQQVIVLLERAIALDPTLARAYAELASAYVTRLAYVTPGETGDLEQKAFSAAEKAVSLDPNVPEAYLARGDLLWTNSHRFAHERAVHEFRRALDLNPQVRRDPQAARAGLRARGILRRGDQARRHRAHHQSEQLAGAEFPRAGAAVDGKGRRGPRHPAEHSGAGPAGARGRQHYVRPATARQTGRGLGRSSDRRRSSTRTIRTAICRP